MSLRKRHSAEVRWAHLHELDRRIHVGTRKFRTLPLRIKHLMAWRRMHKVAGSHLPIRMYGTRHRTRPSSNLRLEGKVSKVAYTQRGKKKV